MVLRKDQAYREFISNLAKGNNKPVIARNFHKCRHKLVCHDGVKYYLIFKKEHYNTFKTRFYYFYMGNEDKYNGMGESINKECLDICIRAGVHKIVFILPFSTYWHTPQCIKKFCDDNKLTKVQDKENVYQDHKNFYSVKREITYSFPIEFLNKWDWEDY